MDNRKTDYGAMTLISAVAPRSNEMNIYICVYVCIYTLHSNEGTLHIDIDIHTYIYNIYKYRPHTQNKYLENILYDLFIVGKTF